MNTASLTAPHSDRRRWMALVVVCLAQLMIVLDTTIVNVALPAIQRDLHFTQGNLTWVVNAFLVTFGSFLLLAGRLGDLLGRSACSSPESSYSRSLLHCAAWRPVRVS